MWKKIQHVVVMCAACSAALAFCIAATPTPKPTPAPTPFPTFPPAKPTPAPKPTPTPFPVITPVTLPPTSVTPPPSSPLPPALDPNLNREASKSYPYSMLTPNYDPTKVTPGFSGLGFNINQVFAPPLVPPLPPAIPEAVDSPYTDPSQTETLPPANKQFEYFMGQAESLVAQKKFYEAMEPVSRADSRALTTAEKQRVVAVYVAINGDGNRINREADTAMATKDYKAAMKLYYRTVALYSPYPCAVAAKKAMDKAQADPDVKAYLQELQAADTAAAIRRLLAPKAAPARNPATQPAVPQPSDETPQASLSELILAAAPDMQARAMPMLELMVKNYPLAPTAKAAGEELTALKANAKLMAALNQQGQKQKAQSMLKMAQMLTSNGLPAKARPYLDDLIQMYPDSDEAKTARGMLGQK